jgi:hypothetical protein
MNNYIIKKIKEFKANENAATPAHLYNKTKEKAI